MTAMRGGLAVNAAQATVVDSIVAEHCTVISAGAGSGKTHTMLAAVLELIDRKEASIEQFALITFTRAAAGVLRARLEKELTSRAQDDSYWAVQLEMSTAAFVGTIHAYCGALVTRFAYSGDMARSDKRASTARFLEAAVAVIVEENLASGGPLGDFEIPQYEVVQKLKEVLESFNNSGRSVSDVVAATRAQRSDPGEPYRVAFVEAVASIAEEFRRLKSNAGVMDAQDLLYEAAHILAGEENVAVVQGTVARWPILLVDEFQDTDRTQKSIFDALSGALAKLVVVGDPRQSIYRFRGADVSLLEALADEQTGSPPLYLPISRRPTHVLLEAQKQLLSGLRDRYPQIEEAGAPDPEAGQPESPMLPLVYVRADRNDELDKLAFRIRELLDEPFPGHDRRLAPRDLTILVRSNWQVDAFVTGLQDELRTTGIAVVAEAGEGFYHRPAVIATYRVLAAALDYPNDALLSGALATAYFSEVDPSVVEAQKLQYNVHEGAMLTDWFEANHPDASAALNALRSSLKMDTAPQFLARLYDVFGIKDHFNALGDSSSIDDLERLREQARALFRNEEALTVQTFADSLRISILRNRGLATDETPTVAGSTIRVMTIHRAKGREFPVVLLPGMRRPLSPQSHRPWFVASEREGLDLDVPTTLHVDTKSADWDAKMRAARDAELQEEMRLLYVAITRAKHQVNFVGGLDRRLNPRDNEFYSWADEVLRVINQVPGAVVR